MKKSRGKFMYILLIVGIFTLSFFSGVLSKVVIKPSWAKSYSVVWNDNLGTLVEDISYGDGEYNKFDLYLPKDNSRKNYGLVVYLHAGGFTSGDKKDDRQMLSWLCSKGYVAVGVNYTLRTDMNNSSVLQQSNEIKHAMPVIVQKAKEYGYHINEMAVAGGSAGHCLAMIYAYRDCSTSPVPVKLTFGAVGPSSFIREDWGIFGLDQDTEESIHATADLFGIMAGVELTTEMVKNGSYEELMKPISAYAWINKDSVPTVIAYGTYDKVQPFLASKRLLKALQDNRIDYKFFELTHSGHGLQNDDEISRQWMETVEEYLDKYMPIGK